MKMQIQKIKNTCIFLDSVLYKPIATKDNIDYYELPCELQKSYEIKVIHYAGDSFSGIDSVIDRNGNSAYKSVIKEMTSFNIDLYYFEMTAFFTVTKQKAFISIETERIENKDFIGKSSHCILKIKQRINVEISDSITTNCYPSKKVKYLVFLIEAFTIPLEFLIYIMVLTAAIHYYVNREIWYNNEIGIYPYIVFIPLTIVIIILMILEIRRVIKRTLRID